MSAGNIKELTKSEEQMMDIFWSSDEALTSVDIVKMNIKETWSNGLVHNIIRSLLKKGLLTECGMERYSTQYARKLAPAISREEYAAKLLILKVNGKVSMARVIVALAKETGETDNLIEELEKIIEEMRTAGEQGE